MSDTIDSLIAAYARKWVAYQITDAELRVSVRRLLVKESASVSRLAAHILTTLPPAIGDRS